MELFTLGNGSGSYTETDIKDAARTFTGWGYNLKSDFTFRQNQHDDGVKAIFGQTGNFKAEDVIRLLLEKSRPHVSLPVNYTVSFLMNKQTARKLSLGSIPFPRPSIKAVITLQGFSRAS